MTETPSGQLYESLIQKAWSDPAFREALRAEPRATIERELSIALPEGVEIHVVEETPTKVYLVIPPAPARAEGKELSDDELGMVAGGVVTPYGAMSAGKTSGSSAISIGGGLLNFLGERRF